MAVVERRSVTVALGAAAALVAVGGMLSTGAAAHAQQQPVPPGLLTASAEDLARSYHAVSELLEWVDLAQRGLTVHTPRGAIGPDNADSARAELERRRSVYGAAIVRRGHQAVDGPYRAQATRACERIQSHWAAGVREGVLRDLRVEQDSFAIRIIHHVPRDGDTLTVEMSGVTVGSALVFDDFLNPDFGFVGEIAEGKISLRPDADAILAAWPEWVHAPRRRDLSRCTITLVGQTG